MTDYPNNIPTKLEIIKASEIAPKEVRWLWYPYIPFGKVTLLQGDPGDGKSKLMLSLAALLSKGAPLPFADEDESGEPMTVIYQTTEDDADDTVVRDLIRRAADGWLPIAKQNLKPQASRNQPTRSPKRKPEFAL
ncbi:MAG: AAA family ATPase [Eubacteriales bacterium]|nr:AAA family ATPase [Christensenellaceae bacterium]MDY2748347.1 AAA family ATPase [Eubacteriales bacterium]